MSATSSSTSRIKRPVIVKVPAPAKKERFSQQQAEKTLEKEGFRPTSDAESKRLRKFLSPNQ